MNCTHENFYNKKISWNGQKQTTTIKLKCDDCGAGATMKINHLTKHKKCYGELSLGKAWTKTLTPMI